MDLNRNLLARLMLARLPGLLGAMQAAAAPALSVNDLALPQRNRNVNNALLSAASALLSPSANRYPLGPLERLSAPMGETIQNGGAGQPQVLEALGMRGRGGQSRMSAIAPPRPAGPAPRAQAASKRMLEPAAVVEESLTVALPVSRGASPSEADKQLVRRAAGVQRRSVSPLPKLRQFTGRLGSRLGHPPVLPGGWKLYGYDRGTGNPVYIGPGGQLGIYI